MLYLTSIVLSLPLIGAYGIFAIGIVLIYRASRVLNLAHGAMAMLPGYLLYEASRAGFPLAAGLPLGIAGGGLLGLAIERVFVRRLRGESLTSQTVGTVAALGLLVAIAARVWGTSSLEATPVFPDGRLRIGLSSIQVGELGLFVVMLVIAAALFILIQRTDLGLMMRGTAESRLAASLMGVNPQQITTFTWVLGGCLAALAGILLAAVTSLHPYVLTLQALPAFIAALIGGLSSMPGALLGAAIVGVTQGLVPVLGPLAKWPGAPQLLLTVVAMVAMARRGERLVAGDIRAALAESPRASARGKRRGVRSGAGGKGVLAGSLSGMGTGKKVLATLGIAGALAFPVVAPFSMLGAVNLASIYALVAISLVVLTGWVGQISLGQAALVGIGAYTTGGVAAAMGIPFPLSLPLAALATAGVAVLLGVVALRVRGLYLAVATLVFSWMASEFLFRQRWFIRFDQIPDRLIGGKGFFPSFDFTNRKVFYVLAWAIVAAFAYIALNARDSKTGRAFFAVRGSEMAAASLGIDIMRTKLLAFALAGAVAGAAGNLAMSMQRVITADQFTFTISLFFLSVAVVGGLSSLGGAIASALLFGGLTELFFRVRALGGYLEIVSALLLAITLIVYRGGLTALPDQIRKFLPKRKTKLKVSLAKIMGLDRPRQPKPQRPPRPRVARRPALRLRMFAPVAKAMRVLSKVSKYFPAPVVRVFSREGKVVLNAESPIQLDISVIRRGLATEVNGPAGGVAPEDIGPAPEPDIGPVTFEEMLASGIDHRLTDPREVRRPLIEAKNVTVRFGGLIAVNNASLSVREGEIVGLIGPNGAGKTTLFNSVAGFNTPTEGSIFLYGKDVTKLPVHLRAQVGVARTFQLLQLFGELTVYENLLVATHVGNSSGFFAHLVATEKSLGAERAARDRVEQALGLLELKQIAYTRAADLPFGILRMVEVARSLVTGFRLIMLDEPASGLDNRETDRLMEVLRFVRGLGVTLLVIEHDVRMVTGVSDYMYVLDQGKMISEGTPEHIQADPAVIAAYLGEPAGDKELVS